MKIYHALDENSHIVPQKDKEKIAILKLVEIGKYVKNVGIRDGQFYVIAEDNADEIYLEYRQAINAIEAAFMPRFDHRLIEQKTMEFHNKRAEKVRQVMEMPK